MKMTEENIRVFVDDNVAIFKEIAKGRAIDYDELVALFQKFQDVTSNNEHKKIFVGAPYYSDEAAGIEKRVSLAAKYCSELMVKGHNAVCVNLLGHLVVAHGEIPNDFDYWDKFSFSVLVDCDELHVLMLDGWEMSKGVKAEIKFANEHNIPVKYIEREYFKTKI